MLNLAEYRKKTTGLCDYLPWACLIGPGIVLNKDGSFQRTLRYRGPDLDSATEAELVSITARLNNVLKRFGDGWALFFEAERVPANQYPGARFADAASWLVDQERYAAFSADGAHHESRYYLTFLYLPPPDREGRAERLLYERTEGEALEPDAHAQLEYFQTETARALELLSAILPEAEALGDAETLTYLHGTISTRRHGIAVPPIPAHLDAILCDTPLLGGVEPKLGDQHLRVLTILGFPNATTPGLLDALERSWLLLPLGDALDRPGQDAGDKASHPVETPVVRQAQVGGGHPARGDVQPRERPRRSGCREQGARRRRGAAGAGCRRCRLRPPHHGNRRFRQRYAPGQREAAGGRAHRQRPRLRDDPGDARTPSRPGSARCPATPMPTCASRSCTP